MAVTRNRFQGINYACEEASLQEHNGSQWVQRTLFGSWGEEHVTTLPVTSIWENGRKEKIKNFHILCEFFNVTAISQKGIPVALLKFSVFNDILVLKRNIGN